MHVQCNVSAVITTFQELITVVYTLMVSFIKAEDKMHYAYDTSSWRGRYVTRGTT
jgi:hypothetical protein